MNSPHLFQHGAPRPTTDDVGLDWARHLPARWRDQVVAPLDFTEHREYEMPASRSFGYDIDGKLCYYAHCYTQEQSRSDDGAEHYPVVAYGETVHAWQLRDARWLVYRIVQSSEDGAPARGFYSFSEKPPR